MLYLCARGLDLRITSGTRCDDGDCDGPHDDELTFGGTVDSRGTSSPSKCAHSIGVDANRSLDEP